MPLAKNSPFPSADRASALLEKLIPGRSPAVQTLRRELLNFAGNLASRTVHLAGPVGSGKSTLARTIAFLRRIAPLSAVDAERSIANVRYDSFGALDPRILPWYVELPLTGLVESLAEAQLFGVALRTATGVDPREGVFEQAATGRGGAGQDAARATGGVVFLDEIADLPKGLQSKLLTVLSSGAFCRVGHEGKRGGEQTFTGVVITASWKAVTTGAVRADLLSRILGQVIRVPGLVERGPEDFRLIVGQISTLITTRFRERVAELQKIEPGMDRAYWDDRIGALPSVDDGLIDQLWAVPWDDRGSLRSLTKALERIIVGGEDPPHVLSETPNFGEMEGVARGSFLMDRLARRAPNGKGLAAHLIELEREDRLDFKNELLRNPVALAVIAEAIGLSEEDLRRQARDLGRRRLKAGEP